MKKPMQLVMTGMFAALLAVLSQIAIPMPSGVPITLQTFAVALCGFALGEKLGLIAVGVYLALGAVGLPVFAEFTGGLGAFLSFSGGFLWGFLILALLCGLGTRLTRKLAAMALGIAGLLLCHICGVLQYALLSSVFFFSSFLLVSAPYLWKDVLSVVLAYLAAEALLFSLKKARQVRS